MSKQQKGKPTKDKYNRPLSKVQGQTLLEQNLLPVNPLNEQFEPTEAEPIRQCARMGGVA
jgi:hypothetical protein